MELKEQKARAYNKEVSDTLEDTKVLVGPQSLQQSVLSSWLTEQWCFVLLCLQLFNAAMQFRAARSGSCERTLAFALLASRCHCASAERMVVVCLQRRACLFSR